MEKSVIVIGGGIAGLAAGVYSQMNGFKTRAFEMHTLPGGLCTSWKRKGYTIDGCIHWLVGSAPKNSFHKIWEELGAIQDRKIVDHEEFTRIYGKDEKVLIVYTDIDRFEAHLKELAPQDGKRIGEFASAVRRLSRIEMPLGKPGETMNFLERLGALGKILPLLREWKYVRLSLQDFSKDFTDPFLREAFPRIFEGMNDFPMIAMAMTLAWMNARAAGYPIGGSLEFARAIEKRFLGLGGQMEYGKKVEKILVENDRAVGVRLSDGTEHRADFVISAADGHATLFEMLEEKYLTPKLGEHYRTLPLFPPLVNIALGLDRDMSNEPHSMSFPLDEPLLIAGQEHKNLGLKHYSYDPHMAPAGKSVIESFFPTDYESWKNLYQDREAYRAEKARIADDYIRRLEKRFPGIKDQVEMVDVATPVTFERYTGNWRASFEGWLITTKTAGMELPKTLPGLKNFYMAGQWVMPGGGLPTAALTAKQVVQILCHQEKKSFKATV